MEKKVKYFLDASNGFVIENYNQAKPFSSFFPGIAGLYGIPLWLFYVNRGQCVASFGTKDKDAAIMEFFPANHAYELTPERGFRTFIKIRQKNKTLFYEPFQETWANQGYARQYKMIITSHDLRLEEINKTLGLKVTVTYFTVPGDVFAGLARIVTLENISSKKIELELLDGMPQIIPYGASYGLIKDMSRTLEAWMQVRNLEKRAPFFNLKVVVADKPQVTHIEAGNFYLSFRGDKGKAALLDMVVDPTLVFGPAANFALPAAFIESKRFTLPRQQNTDNFTPAAMSFQSLRLNPQRKQATYAIAGNINSVKTLNRILGRVACPEYILEKQKQNQNLVLSLCQKAFTAGNLREFNLYCGQTYLDNLMRGGFPVVFKDNRASRVFYAYSRKHGDLERDYNRFLLSPTYFSQGNGNYRDINQNRRCDLWFNPEVRESNLATFMNLVQADGFNPLVLSGVYFKADDSAKPDKVLAKMILDNELRQKIRRRLGQLFTPGDILREIETSGVKLKIGIEEFIKAILLHSQCFDAVSHQEGFWIDHWAYNLDLLENYLGVYPERLKEILLEKKIFSFYHNDAYVVTRGEKYVLHDGKVRQLHAVHGEGGSAHKPKAGEGGHWLRSGCGKGEVYKTTLLVKLITLMVNKLASLDHRGVGMEMEADKPSWYDALNGLPGLFGSSLPETLELKRLIIFTKDCLKQLALDKNSEVKVFAELYDFLTGLRELLRKNLEEDGENADFIFWDQSRSLKEVYGHNIRFGIDGEEKALSQEVLSGFMELALRKIERGLGRAIDRKTGLYYTYFANRVIEYEHLKDVDTEGRAQNRLSKDGLPCIAALRFAQEPLPLFLEAIVHALRIEKDKLRAKDIYKAVRRSALFDRKLKMYKVCAALKGESEEIGRARVFNPGWLENESIWLHMEYKYLLELLRCGLYEEFYADIRTMLVPYMAPEVYGRSILENSSFIASSAYPDPKLHGAGFVARLSGSTAEFLNIWLWLNVGLRPFSIDNKGKLILRFEPILNCAMFLKDKQQFSFYRQDGKSQMLELPRDSYGFKFLGKTLVVYHNPQRKDTYGKNPGRVREIVMTKNNREYCRLKGPEINEPYSYEVRDGFIERIDVYLE